MGLGAGVFAHDGRLPIKFNSETLIRRLPLPTILSTIIAQAKATLFCRSKGVFRGLLRSGIPGFCESPLTWKNMLLLFLTAQNIQQINYLLSVIYLIIERNHRLSTFLLPFASVAAHKMLDKNRAGSVVFPDPSDDIMGQQVDLRRRPLLSHAASFFLISGGVRSQAG
jgi:hypothetical protein